MLATKQDTETQKNTLYSVYFIFRDAECSIGSFTREDAEKLIKKQNSNECNAFQYYMREL